jgi:hypothetical protein
VDLLQFIDLILDRCRRGTFDLATPVRAVAKSEVFERE